MRNSTPTCFLKTEIASQASFPIRPTEKPLITSSGKTLLDFPGFFPLAFGGRVLTRFLQVDNMKLGPGGATLRRIAKGRAAFAKQMVTPDGEDFMSCGAL